MSKMGYEFELTSLMSVFECLVGYLKILGRVFELFRISYRVY